MKRVFIILFILANGWVFGGDGVYFNEKKIKDLFLNTDKYIYATSQLKEKGYDFKVENLVDENAKLPWSVRKNGGVEEEIMLIFYPPAPYSEEKWARGLNIINGFHQNPALFDQNNRAKEMDVYLYKIYYDARDNMKSPRGEALLGFYLIESNSIELKDGYAAKNLIYFKTDLEKEDKTNNTKKHSVQYAMVLKIKSVYKGSKYNDLCISKINFLYDWPVTNN